MQANIMESDTKLFRPEILRVEQKILTPDQLYEDNTSLASGVLREQWNHARSLRQLDSIWTCVDARVITPYLAYIIRTIASGGSPVPFASLFENSRSVIVVAHYDGRLVVQKERPPGCGGQDEKALMTEETDAVDADDIATFVRRQISHEDAILNACLRASQLAVVTNKPVVAAGQDHRTGMTKVIDVFENKRGRITNRSDLIKAQMLKFVMKHKYNPEELYENGIPWLNPEDVPDFFADIVQQQEIQLRVFEKKYGNLSDWNKVQNPHTLLISSDPRPTTVKYPGRLGGPNQAITVRVPRMSFPNKGFVSDDHSIRLAAQQAQYPVAQAVQNFGNPDMPFNGLYTVLVEARNSETCQVIIGELANRDWMKQFLQLPGRQVLAGIVQEGILKDCQRLAFV